MSKIRQTAADTKREDEVAVRLSKAWGWEISRFGTLDQIDFYGLKGKPPHDKLCGLLEIKCRTHPIDKYETVYLSLRKWLALGMAQAGMNIGAFFAASFKDGEVRYIAWQDVDARRFGILGRRRDPPSPNDMEPIIEVSINQMSEL